MTAGGGVAVMQGSRTPQTWRSTPAAPLLFPIPCPSAILSERNPPPGPWESDASLPATFKTLREAPAEAETASHQLMLRAGMLQRVAAGIYSYGPLAQRSLNKIANILREEMDAIGGQEVRLPAVQPLDLWEQSGRAAAFGEDMVRLKDRRGRPMVIAPPMRRPLPSSPNSSSRATATSPSSSTRSRPSSATNPGPAAA